MKRLFSLILVVVLLLNVACVVASAEADKKTIAHVVFSTSTPYFARTEQRTYDICEELGYNAIYTGPAVGDSAEFIDILDNMINQKVDALLVANGDSSSACETLKRAREAGILVITWDTKLSDPEAYDISTGAADQKELAAGLIENVIAHMGTEGQFAILTGNLTSASQMQRIDFIKEGIAENYPGLELVAVEPVFDDTEKAFTISQNLLTTYPNLKAIMSNTSTAIGPIGKAIEDAGLVGEVYACGQSTPNIAKPAIEAGTCLSCTLWDTADWIEMAIRLADKMLKGEEIPTEGKVDIPGFENVCWGEENTRLMLNKSVVWDKDNIGEYDF